MVRLKPAFTFWNVICKIIEVVCTLDWLQNGYSSSNIPGGKCHKITPWCHQPQNYTLMLSLTKLHADVISPIVTLWCHQPQSYTLISPATKLHADDVISHKATCWWCHQPQSSTLELDDVNKSTSRDSSSIKLSFTSFNTVETNFQ